MEVAERDKVRRLAEKQTLELMTATFTSPPTNAEISANLERTLRAELKPLLDAAERIVDGTQPEEWRRNDTALLAAELQQWRAKEQK